MDRRPASAWGERARALSTGTSPSLTLTAFSNAYTLVLTGCRSAGRVAVGGGGDRLPDLHAQHVVRLGVRPGAPETRVHQAELGVRARAAGLGEAVAAGGAAAGSAPREHHPVLTCSSCPLPHPRRRHPFTAAGHLIVARRRPLLVGRRRASLLAETRRGRSTERRAQTGPCGAHPTLLPPLASSACAALLPKIAPSLSSRVAPKS